MDRGKLLLHLSMMLVLELALDWVWVMVTLLESELLMDELLDL